MKLGKGLLVLALPMLALATPSSAQEGQEGTSASNVYTVAFERVDGSSTLVRTKDAVAMTVNLRQLDPGSVYTAWWVNFNNPQQCVERCRCGAADFANSAVDIGVFWAAGRVADAYGQAQLAGIVAYGELPQGDDQVPLAPSFASPIDPGAEIHWVMRSHGPASNDPDVREDQLTKFEEFGAVDSHFTIHRSPNCK